MLRSELGKLLKEFLHDGFDGRKIGVVKKHENGMKIVYGALREI